MDRVLSFMLFMASLTVLTEELLSFTVNFLSSLRLPTYSEVRVSTKPLPWESSGASGFTTLKAAMFFFRYSFHFCYLNSTPEAPAEGWHS